MTNYDPIMVDGKLRQPTECYSRVCGYMRPVKQWNDAQQEIFKNRKLFKV